jgi:transcriptional regulator GlxA family with amidase domain
MRRVLNHMNAHYAETLRLQALVELAVLSIAQLERHFRRVF